MTPRAVTTRLHEAAKATIPPRRNAKIQQHGNCKALPHLRDVNLRRVRQVGRKQWKHESRYHQRSLSETAMFRLKTIFGVAYDDEVLIAKLLSYFCNVLP